MRLFYYFYNLYHKIYKNYKRILINIKQDIRIPMHENNSCKLTLYVKSKAEAFVKA